MPKLSRSLKKTKPYIRLLKVAGLDTEMRLQGSEDITPVLRGLRKTQKESDFRKMTRAFCDAFQLQHVKSERL